MEMNQVISVTKTCKCCNSNTLIRQYTSKLHVSEYDISEIVEFLKENNPNAHLTKLSDTSLPPNAFLVCKYTDGRLRMVDDICRYGELFFYISIITTEQIDKQIGVYFPGIEDVRLEDNILGLEESAWLNVAYEISKQLSNDNYIVECYNNNFGKTLDVILNKK